MVDAALRLRAHSAEDIPLLSSLCQDSITKRQDMTFDTPRKRFVLIANRFCWEREMEKRSWLRPRPQPMRVRSALRFDFVERVQFLGPVQSDDDTPLNLLALALAETQMPQTQSQEPLPKLLLSFSEGMKIALTCEVVDVTLDDLSAPWTAKTRPEHNT